MDTVSMNLHILLTAAREARANGEHHKAGDLFGQYITHNPHASEDVYLAQARCYQQAGSINDAISSLRNAQMAHGTSETSANLLSQLLINSAREARANGEHHKAGDLFGQYITHNPHASEDVYLAQARCYQQAGSINDAISSLRNAQMAHGTSDEILIYLLDLLEYRRDWTSSIEICRTLLEKHPENISYIYQLGRINALNGNFTRAELYYKKYLHLTGNIIDRATISAEKSISTFGLRVLRSSYTLPGGLQTLGLLRHKTESDREFITKLSLSESDVKTEKKFYMNVYPLSGLSLIAPSLHLIEDIDGVTAMTFEALKVASCYSLEDVIRLWERITKVSNSTASKHFTNPRYGFVIKSGEGTIMNFFTEIHQHDNNIRIINSLRAHAAQNSYPDSAHIFINDLEDIIINTYIAGGLDPERHYTLCHGDFKAANIGISSESGELKAFDWGSFRIGLRTLDIARYAQDQLVPYDSLCSQLVFNPQRENPLEDVEVVFFLYAYVLFHWVGITRHPTHSANYIMAEFIDPAIKDMRKIVQRLL